MMKPKKPVAPKAPTKVPSNNQKSQNKNKQNYSHKPKY